MDIFRANNHLQAVKIFFMLPFFFWTNYSLCRANIPSGPVKSNIEVCLLYCTQGNTQPQIFQFCQCRTGVKTGETTSLLQTWGHTDIVGIQKHPVDNTYICQAMCLDLAECDDWHYDQLRSLCFLGNQDPRQANSLATHGWKGVSSTPKGKARSNAVLTPTMQTSSGSKYSNMSTSLRNNDSNDGTTPPTTGMSSNKAKSSNMNTSKTYNDSNDKTTPPTTEMSSNIANSSNMSTSQRYSDSNDKTTPPTTGMSSNIAKSSNKSTSQRYSDSKNGATPPTSPVTKSTNDTGQYNGTSDRKHKHTVVKTISQTLVIRRLHLPKIMVFNFNKDTSSCRLTCSKFHSTCLNDQCVCQAGYAEQPQDNTCTKECKLFSANFTLQSTTRCSKTYYKKHSGVGEEGCRELCMAGGRHFCVAFQVKDGNCYLLDRGGAWPKVQWERNGNCAYYQRNCEAPVVSTCNNCQDESHRCNNGVCQCAMGYSKVQGSFQCVRECPLYSSVFAVQSNRLCKTIHHTLYRDVTEDWCKQKCLATETDVCLAYEYRHHTCFLMTKRWIDKNGPWEDWTECTHYQRECKTCDDTCVSPNYVCDRGLCHCNIGYSTTLDNKCVKGCNTFTKTFTKSAQTKCMKNYPVSHSSSSPEDCREKCLREKFKCAAFAFDGKKCHTVMWDKVSFHPKDWYYSPSCAHYTRQCDHKGGDCLTTCRLPNYICKDRKCVCNIGYSTTKDGKCVRGCRYFKDSFTMRETGVCMVKYQNKYPGLTEHWCKKKCLKSSYQCGSFEVTKNNCYIAKWKEKYYQTEMWEPHVQCKHYTRDCKDKGSDCDVCDGPQYQCREKTCVCGRGYSFVVGVATCHRECVSYADSFTKQSSYHCVRHYVKKYPQTTAKQCEHKCRQEKGFACGAFHYYKGSCYTMKWDLKSLEKTWEHKSKPCEHYTRDCNPNCEMGYSLIPDKNRCVLDCKVNSNKFQKQSDVVCITKYHRKVKDIGVKSCERACLQTKHCDGYELYQNDCYIIRENKGSEPEWKVYNEGCTHYQRICKE